MKVAGNSIEAVYDTINSRMEHEHFYSINVRNNYRS
jgi:hypothetical protein